MPLRQDTQFELETIWEIKGYRRIAKNSLPEICEITEAHIFSSRIPPATRLQGWDGQLGALF
jgi:HD superfamily phosphodiesterase